MKHLFAFVVLFAFSASAALAGTNAYRINDDAVEAAFSQSQERVLLAPEAADLMETNWLNNQARVDNPDATTAGILALLVGTLGIHRIYMNSPFKVAVYYWLTCGGFWSVLPIIDAIKILTVDDISPYIGNEKLKMW